MKIGIYVVGLVTVVLAIAGTITQGSAQEVPTAKGKLTYISSNKCKLCHNKPGEGQQYATWQSMGHAHAFETLLSENALSIAKEKGLSVPPSESADCLKCHVTGYDVEKKMHPAQLRMEDGIQCDSCHGPGSAHMADGKTLRMNKDADIDVLANLIHPDANTCVTCHNPESPTWNPARYVLESGEKNGFNFDEAVKIISHMNPKKAKD